MPGLTAPQAAIAQAGANLMETGINALATGSANRATRKWNEKMYGIQRADSLADWNMQNEYNSPKNVMARYKEAGLNPNLIYGNGTNASAGTVRSSSPGSYTARPVQLDLGAGSVLGAYYDTQLKSAQVDNLKATNTVIAQDALLKAAQILNMNTSTRTKEFDLAMKETLKETSLEAARVQVEKLKADTQMSFGENARREMMKGANLDSILQRIAESKAREATTKAQRDEIYQRIENMKKDGQLKQFDINLRKMGINPGDPIYLRFLAQMFNGKLTEAETRNVKETFKRSGWGALKNLVH